MRARTIASRGVAGCAVGAAAVVLGAPSAAKTRIAAGRVAAGGGTLAGDVALPSSGNALVDEFVLHASVPSGRVGSLNVRSTNDSQLPSGIRAVVSISPASSKSRSATFELVIAINNLGATTTKAITAAEVALHFQVYGKSVGVTYKERQIHLKRLTCEQLVNESNEIDKGVKSGSISIDRLRPKDEQPSPDEEVFDFSAANIAMKMKPPCKGVEGPDAGND